MEQNNLEDLIKTTLDQRNIKPSPEAKERLINVLNSKPRKKPVLWFRYGIAASIVFLLFFVLGKLILKNDNINQLNRVTIQKETPELKEDKEPIFYKENKIVSGDQPILIYNNKTQPKDSSSVLYSDNSNINIPSQNSLKHKEDVPLEVPQEIHREFEEVVSNFKSQNEAIVLENKSLNDSTQLKTTNVFTYISPENLLAVTQSDTSLQLSSGKQKLPDMYVNSDDLLLEMERQLFDDKHKNFFKKAGKRLKKLNEAIANRNYEH